MADQPTDGDSEAAAAAIGENRQKLGSQRQRLFQAYLNQLCYTEKVPFDLATVGNAFLKMSGQMLTDPQRLAEAQAALWQQYAALWRLSVAPNRCSNFRPGTARLCSSYTDTVSPICIPNASRYSAASRL